MRRAAAFSATVLTLAAAAAGAGPASAPIAPPSSLRPELSSVQVLHTHRVVKECRSDKRAETHACSPKTHARGEPKTALELIPRPARPLELEASARERVSIEVGSDGTSGAEPRRLAPGRWEITWHDKRRLVTLSAGPTTRIQLETVTGRCTPTNDGCRLAESAVARNIAVTTQ